jgi:perosamine synthetase
LSKFDRQKKLIYLFGVKKKLIACEIGPNYQLDDGLLAIKSLILLPWIKFVENDINLHSRLLPYFENNSPNMRLVDSGRTGLTILLKSLDLEPESEVLIQGFSCVVVPNSVLQAGLVPVLCDIDENNFNLDLTFAKAKITSKTRVLIIQYTFGIIPDMDKVLDFCTKCNIILIEDCAHIFNQKIKLQNQIREVGSLGYGSVLSFGRDKVISSTVGGAVVLNDKSPQYKANLDLEYNKLSNMSTWKECQSLFYCILSVFFIRPYYHYGLGKLVLFVSRKIHLIGEIYSLDEKKGTSTINNSSKYSNVLANILENQLKKIAKYQLHRQKISDIYTKELNLDTNNGNCLRFPISVPETHYLDIKKSLRKEYILVGTWYNSLFIPAEAELAKFNYHLGDLPICEKLATNKVLNLPTNIQTTELDAKQITDIIRPFLVSK